MLRPVPPQPPTPPARLSPAVAALFFASGATSLGFELVWTKQLGVLLGGTTTAVAWVVALFMGGMALGYFAGGRMSQRMAQPVKSYGLCEMAMAGWGLLACHALPSLPADWPEPLLMGAAGLVLLPCTVLAGATLPMLVQATRGNLGAALGRLYALNTLGAVAGVLAAGLVLIGQFGLQGTGGLLAAAGLLVGAMAMRLPMQRLPAEPEESDVATGPRPAAGWLAAAGVAGAASLAEEVLWTRALTAHFNASTYAFAAILAVFLVGLALGAAAAVRWIDAGRSPRTLLAASQVALSLLVLFTPAAMLWAEHWLPGYAGVRQIGSYAAFVGMVATGLGRTALALLLPTMLLGMALPLIGAELKAGKTRGAATGWLVGCNAVGAAAGSLGARFVLLPLLGVQHGLAAAGALHGLLGLLVGARAIPRGVFAGLLLGWMAMFAAIQPSSAPSIGRLARNHRLLLVDEGVQDTTAVVEMPGPPPVRQIVANGIAYAGDSPTARRYMRLLGHLPALLARQQDRAMVICLGTGMTASSVLRHAGVQHAELVDISPVVSRTLRQFDHVNDKLAPSQRASIVRQDGRIFLARAAPQSYDIITLEPPPPRVAGVAALYSRQFYQQAKRALKPGGAIAQWLPLHGMTDAELRMLARTFAAEFAGAKLIKIADVEAALVATNGAGADLATVHARLAAAGVAAHMAEIGVADPLALPTIGADRLAQALGDGPLVTDDDPRIEQFAAGLPAENQSTDRAGLAFMAGMWR